MQEKVRRANTNKLDGTMPTGNAAGRRAIPAAYVSIAQQIRVSLLFDEKPRKNLERRGLWPAFGNKESVQPECATLLRIILRR